ncbi:glycosyltransferase family 9 protein [Pseudoroseomonas cervicalis]|uniref:glycosyltransferase family 9 protein n=1 Tax=Teichococcus cervicalis TaxID=204525 RepID=UPI002784BD11|nr:glycosyltransferase family 9 protein [Pseudoroseomonas cervicalis]MDQ1079568.1 hypothetical protein [Pseudoroseomonas cervicalis]
MAMEGGALLHSKAGIIWTPHGTALSDQRQALQAAGLLAVTLLDGTPDALIRAVFAAPPALIYAAGADAADILAIRGLRAPIVWDLSALALAAPRLREEEAYRAAFAQALARVDAVVRAPAALREAVEDVLSVGIPALDTAAAVRQLGFRVAVSLGSGLGNMMNATPMIRWIAERTGRRVTVIISSDLTQGVQLFNDSPWIDFIFPGFEYTAGRHYDVLVSTALASHAEPFCTATTWLQQNKLYDFNVHGRFIREADIYFLGLDRIFGPTPLLDAPLPQSFLRDIRHAPEGPRIIGIANGIKQGTWAKRQWPYVQQLADRLRAEGWTLRCFGLPEELVAGTEDYTGLSIRDTLKAIAACSYFIGHDGGMCHIAETLGVPTLWLFGPTAYRKNGPFYAQSRVVSTMVSCGPCNFKIDWLRCSDPVCMLDMSVERVAQEFAALQERAARLGPQPIWAPTDTALIEYELGAPGRPSKAELLPQLSAERIILYPRDAAFAVRTVADLLRCGDFEGAATLAATFRDTLDGPPARLLQLLQASLRSILGHASDAPEPALAPQPIVETMFKLQLMPAQFRAVSELLFHAQLRQGNAAGALQLLEQVRLRGSGPLSSWGLKQWVRAALQHAPAEIRGRAEELKALCSSNRGLTARLTHALDEAALLAAWQDFLGAAEGEVPLASGRPSLLGGLAAAGAPVPLALPGGEAVLAPWSTVLIVAPACDPTVTRPGSASSVLVLLARRLAAAGLCPVIASTSQVTERPRFEFRDNVTYVHGSRVWSPQIWQRLVQDMKPRLVLSVEGMAAALSLAIPAPVPVVDLSLNGLYDADGLASLLLEEISMGVPAPRRGAGWHTPDTLLAVLPHAGGLQHPLRPRPGPVYLMVNDTADLARALALPRRCPQMSFVIIADAISRGVDPNIRFIPRKTKLDWGEMAEGMGAFVQYSPAPATLCAEALEVAKAGVRVVAPTALAAHPAYASMILAPADPAKGEEWVTLLRQVMGGVLPEGAGVAA